MTLPEYPNVNMPGKKEIVLLPEDDAAYFDLLAETFPDIRFLDHPYSLPKGERPMAKTVRTLAECTDSYGRILIVFDPSWTPTWKSEERKDKCGWDLTGPIPYPNGEYECSAGVWSFSQVPASETETAEFIHHRRLYFSYLAGNEADARTVQKALRLFSKVASNRKLMWVNPYTGKVGAPDMRYGPWIGHHARRWCLERPGRFLAGWDDDPEHPHAFLPWPADAKAPPVKEGQPWPMGAFPRPPTVETIVYKVVLSPQDQIAYATLLREAMPGVRFLDPDFVKGYKTQSAGSELFPDSCSGVSIVFDPSWQPGFSCAENSPPGSRRLQKICYPIGMLDRWYHVSKRADHRNWGNPPLSYYISPRILAFRYISGSQKQKRTVHAALRLLGKIADNRRLVRIDPRTREVLDENALDGPWIGHHARRWCLERPDRDFATWELGSAFRPKQKTERPRAARKSIDRESLSVSRVKRGASSSSRPKSGKGRSN